MLFIARIYCLYCFLSMIATTIAYKKLRSRLSDVQGKIVGGHDAKIKDYPFMVKLVINVGDFSVGCGGSYIRPLWVLTASHCIDLNDNDISLPPTVGLMTRVKSIMGLEERMQTGYQSAMSKKLLMHPKYFRNDSEVNNDIGLIMLQTAFEIGNTVQLVPIPRTEIDYGGEKVVIMGWGATGITDDPEQGRITTTQRLQVLTTVAHDMRDCKRRTGSPSTICIGEKGKISCSGDSGGPLYYSNMVIGVCSYGFGCGGDFAVYENVYSHQTWVSKIAGRQMARSASGTCHFITGTLLIINFLCSMG